MKVTLFILLLPFVCYSQKKINIGPGSGSSHIQVISNDTISNVTVIRDTVNTTSYDTIYETRRFDTTGTSVFLPDTVSSTYKSFSSYGAVAVSTDTDVYDDLNYTAWNDFMADTDQKALWVDGTFNFDTNLVITRTVKILGHGGSANNAHGIFRFHKGHNGIEIHQDADNTVIENITISGATDGSGTEKGLLVSANSIRLEGVEVKSFDGNGIEVSSSLVKNGNTFFILHCRAWNNGGDGYRFGGTDANAGVIIGCDATDNGEWGFSDESFLQNFFFGNHTSNNTLGGYRTTDVNGRAVFVGNYTEGGQPENSFVTNTLWIGGINPSGFTGNGTILHAFGGKLRGSPYQIYTNGNSNMTFGSNDSTLVSATIAGSAVAISYGAAAPTAGGHNKGDIRFNLDPDQGEPSYWQCITAGSPGTWEGFNTITGN